LHDLENLEAKSIVTKLNQELRSEFGVSVGRKNLLFFFITKLAKCGASGGLNAAPVGANYRFNIYNISLEKLNNADTPLPKT